MVYDQSSGDLFVANFSSSLSIDMLTADGSLSTFASGLQATPQFLVIGPQLSSVPEPAAFILASIGFVLVALVARLFRAGRGPRADPFLHTGCRPIGRGPS